jgi:hypothetical protein
MRSNRLRNLGLGFAGLVVFYLLAGFFLLPILIDRTVRGAISDELGLESAIESVAVNPLTLTIEVRGFAIYDREAEPLIGADRLFVNLETNSIIDQALTWSRIGIEGLNANVVIDESGALNILDLIPPDDPDAEPAPASDDGSSLSVIVRDLELIGAAVSFTDRSNDAQLQLGFSPIDLRVRSFFFGLGPDAAGSELDLKIDLLGGGHIEVAGAIDTEPVLAELDIKLERFQLSQLQGLIKTFARLDVRSGRLNVDGRFVYGSETTPALGFDGDVSLDDIVLFDPVEAMDVLRLPRLAFEKINASVDPLSARIERILLSEPYLRFAIEAGGASNFDRILVSTEAGAEAKPSPEPEPADAPLPDVAIGVVRMEDGTIWFDDLSIKPRYAGSLQELTGGIKHIGTLDEGKASIKLAGKTGPKSPLNVSGDIRLFSDAAFMDMQAALRNLDLTAFTPYAGRYVGYGLAVGRMDLDLAYGLEGSQLEGKNAFLVDQLTLGPKVASKDAVKLPLPLGIALIKDASGRIDIDLSVSGDVDDPAFSVGGLVWKAFINLMTKAVTQPFGALAALTGGKPPPDAVEFEPGRTRLGARQAGHLETLASALGQRPALAIILTGTATPGPDRSELARRELDLLVRERHFRGKPDPAQLKAIISSEERRQAMRHLHKKRVKKALAKPTVAESEAERDARMEAEIMSSIEVPNAALIELANDRANAVMEYLSHLGQIESERIRIDDSKIDTKRSEAGGHVEMALEAQ